MLSTQSEPFELITPDQRVPPITQYLPLSPEWTGLALDLVDSATYREHQSRCVSPVTPSPRDVTPRAGRLPTKVRYKYLSPQSYFT